MQRRLPACAIILCSLFACQREDVRRDATARDRTDRIAFDKNAFKKEPPAELPYFELASAPPTDAFLKQLSGNQVEAGFDKEQGSLEFHPDFEALSEGPPLNLEAAPALIERTVATMKLAFADSTDFFVDDAQVLHSAAAHRAASDKVDDAYDAEQPRLLYVTLRRTVENVPVVGPGSRFTAAVQSEGPLRGVVFYWKRLLPPKEQLKSPERAVIEQAIRDQLQRTRPSASAILVSEVKTAFYDSDRTFLQPVMRYVAELKPGPTSAGRTDFVVGYVPFAPQNQKELLEDLGNQDPLPLPGNPKKLPTLDPPAPTQRLPNQISVGRYVGFDEQGGEMRASSGFVRDSEAFRRELSRSPNFVDEQNYYAGRWQFTSRKDWFVNFVDLALVDAHGFPAGFTPAFDYGEVTHMDSDVPLSGYGTAGNGLLKHLIFHSCRTVATTTDPGAESPWLWAQPWWELFKGLSSVTGYRSSMYIDDGASAALARNLRKSQPVVPAWFGTVTSLDAYAKDSAWMRSECTDNEPMGRASAISVCKEGARATVSKGSTPRPTCLEAWWIGDERISLHPDGHPRKATPVKQGKCPDKGGFKPPYPGSHP